MFNRRFLNKTFDLEKINPSGANKKYCKPGGKIENARDQFKTVCNENNVKHVVFCTGTNHIPHEQPLEVATKIINLARDAKTNMPDSQVYVSAVLLHSHLDIVVRGCVWLV